MTIINTHSTLGYFVVFAIVAGCGIQQQREHNVEDLLAIAAHHHSRGEIDEALHTYDIILEADPTNVEALFGRAVIKDMRGDRAAALQDLSIIIDDDPTAMDGHALELRAWVHLVSRNFDSAKSDYEEVLRLVDDPLRQVNAKLRLARALARSAQIEEAMAIYDGLERTDPMNPDVYKGRADMLLDAGQYEKAVEDYGRAIALRPQDGGLYHDRSVAWRMLGERERERADEEKAKELGFRIIGPEE